MDHSMINIKGELNGNFGKKNKFFMKRKIDYNKLSAVPKHNLERAIDKNGMDVEIETVYDILRENIIRSVQESRRPDVWVN